MNRNYNEPNRSDLADAAHKAYVGLGSNLGDRERSLHIAVEHLHHLQDCEVTGCSSIYETAPIGFVEQPSFLNMVVEVQTELAPMKLLQAMMNIEQQLGRIREVKFGPRTIDLDLLLYEGSSMHNPQLTLPHPRMYERLFVLIPLLECIRDDEALSNLIRKHIQQLEDEGGVTLWKRINWLYEFGHSAN